MCQRERGRDVVERPLRDGLEKREHRRRERSRDARLLDEHEREAGAHYCLVVEASNKPKARPEVQLVQLARRSRIAALSEIVELLGLEIEDGRLVVFLGRREIQRVAHAWRERPVARDSPLVLDEVLLEVRPIANLLLLKID